MTLTPDASSGYDAIADAFIAARSQIGLETVRNWARDLPPNADLIDIGAGHGEPLTPALVEAGLRIHAIDASPKLVAAYKMRFPDIQIACETVEDSQFFNRSFDAALMIGLIFLLDEARQNAVFGRLASILRPGGRLLFSASTEAGAWQDMLTGQQNRSLGKSAYEAILERCEFAVRAHYIDEGNNHYFDAERLNPTDAPIDQKSQ